MSLSPDWTHADLAKHLCDDLVAKGHLKDKPAFIRRDREARIADIFESGGLDGSTMISLDNPGPLEIIVRKGTQGEPWVEQVIAGLVQMLPPEAAGAEKRMNMDARTREELAEARESTARRRERTGKGVGRERDDDFASFGSGRYSGGDQECFTCGGYGHFSRDCPESRKGKGRGGGGDQDCFNCGQPGHLSRDCPEPRRGKNGFKGRSRGGDLECYNCGRLGHISRECPEPSRKGRGRGDED